MRLQLGLYRACASLQLAVVLIALLAVVLAWATFVESRLGTPAVRFGIYGTWWFALLGGLLGFNVLCSALIRLPWGKKHFGFLVTHAGILVLLFGCWLTRWKGIDGNVPVLEQDPEGVHRGYLDLYHFQLAVQPNRPGDIKAELITIPFRGGPFNWSDYQDRAWFPWHWARRDQGVLYDEDNIRLEVLDYYSETKYERGPRLKLKLRDPRIAPADASTPAGEKVDAWKSVDLGIMPDLDPNPAEENRDKYGIGEAKPVLGDTRVVFWMTGNRAETEAFRHSRPEGPLGRWGQVVLFAGGRKYHFPVDELFEAARRGSREAPGTLRLGDTALEVAMMPDFNFAELRIKLQVYRDGRPSREIWLHANQPHRDQQDYQNEVFGTYWFEPGPATTRQLTRRTHYEARQSRIDVLQGHDQKLHYRAWRAPQVVEIGPLPIDGSKVTPFPDGDRSSVLMVDEFFPQDTPGTPVALEFAKPGTRKSEDIEPAQARVRLTVDGQQEEFWLARRFTYPFEDLRSDQRRVVHSESRRVTITLQPDEVELGFSIYLREFVEKRYAGTGMPKNFTSKIDLSDLDDPPKVLKSNATITMNAPLDFTDRRTGRSFRLSQQSRRGPMSPRASYQIWRRIGGKTERSLIYISDLGMNYDPGRGTKYAGSLLIVIGMIVVLYARTSFFKKAAS